MARGHRHKASLGYRAILSYVARHYIQIPSAEHKRYFHLAGIWIQSLPPEGMEVGGEGQIVAGDF